MANRPKRLEYYNLHCKFGEYNLLDFAQEFVLPAFKDRTMRRETKIGTYFFHDVEFVPLFDANGDTPTSNTRLLAIAGRFIKDTTVERLQIFDAEEDKLVQDEQTLQSAPSAVFVLILNNHKLLYLRETYDAPAPATFGLTLQTFINRKRHEYLRSLYNQSVAAAKENPNAEKTTQAALDIQYPKPKIEVVPLAGDENLDAGLDRFDIIKQVRFQLITTNDEADNNGLFGCADSRIRLGRQSLNSFITTTKGCRKTELDSKLKLLLLRETQRSKSLETITMATRLC